MKIRNASLATLAILLIVPVAKAQAGSRAATASVPKIAVINLQQAIASTAEGKQASEELRAKFAPRQAALQNLRKQIADIEQRIQAGATTLSDEEKTRLARQGNVLTRRYQRDQQDLQDDGNEAQQDAVNQLGQKMLTILDKYAKEHGYGVVMDNSAQNTPVIYASNQVDITQEIIKLYDQAYPVKSAAPAAARPGTPKPSQK